MIFLFLLLSLFIGATSLLGSGTTEENKENDLKPSLPQSYAATVARPSPSSASTVPGERVGVGTCVTAAFCSCHRCSPCTVYSLPGDALGVTS